MKLFEDIKNFLALWIMLSAGALSAVLMPVIAILSNEIGAVPAAPGSPDLTTDTGSGEIPFLYADKVVEKFYDASAAPFCSNSDLI
jgi:hypothetical protein